jgi:type VI secretion system protein ImpF
MNESLVPSLLFDRLVDTGTVVQTDERRLRALDRGELLDSVQHELSVLLNTRVSLSADELDTEQRTTINYGIPDLAYFSSQDINGWQDLAEALRAAIAAYEPRLLEVTVTIQSVSVKDGKVVSAVRGRLKAGHVDEPVAFPLSIDPGVASMEAKEVDDAVPAEGRS